MALTQYYVRYDFDSNGGSPNYASLLMSSTSQMGTYTIPSSYSPTRSGYSFKGWKHSESGLIVQAGGSVSTTGYDNVGNPRVHQWIAQWEAISSYPFKVVIEYDTNGGTGRPSSQIVTDDDTSQITVTLRPSTPLPPTGYVFDCWYCAKTGLYYDAGETAKFTGAASSSGITYTMVAQWKEKVQYTLSMVCADGVTQRTLSYTLDGETKSSTSDSITFDAGTYVYLSGVIFNNNYNYPVIVKNESSGGEYTMSSSTSTKWSFNGTSAPNSRGYSIRATPSKYEIKISYNSNGGGTAPLAQTAYSTTSTSVSIKLTTSTPTPPTGYRFNGWYCSQTGDYYDAGGTYTFTGSPEVTSYTLVAQWVRIYKVTFNHCCGNVQLGTTSANIDANDTITLSKYAEDFEGYQYSYAEDKDGYKKTTITITGATEVYLIYTKIITAVEITVNHYRGKYLYDTTTISKNIGDNITSSTHQITTIPNCVYSYSSPSSFTVSADTTEISIYYKYAWTNSVKTGQPWKTTAQEWINLQNFVNDQRLAKGSSKYTKFTTPVSKVTVFTYGIYNEMVEAIGKGTTVKRFDPITQSLMEAIVTNANAMAGL